MKLAVVASFAALLGTSLLADDRRSVTDPGIIVQDAGVFCFASDGIRVPAPETESGYIETPQHNIGIIWQQESLPGVEGTAFGIEFYDANRSARPNLRARVYRPGEYDTPKDSWDTSISDNSLRIVFFYFGPEEPIVLGTWRFEVWEGDGLLLRRSFDVVETARLPEIAAVCGPTTI